MDTNMATHPYADDVSLASMLHPMSVEEFFEEYYEKRPLFLTGRSVEDRYPGFPSQDGFEYLLWQHEEKLRRVLRVNRHGEYFSLPHPSQGKSLFRWSIDRLHDGCTLILNGMDTMHVPIARAARSIESTFGGKVAANAFFTPVDQQGFLAHFDTHDVFVLQLEGTKCWPLFDQRVDLPIDRQIYLINQDSVGEPTATYTLEAGDLLYVPRGLVHGPHTKKGHSFHLTMGFRPMRWVDCLASMIQIAAEHDPIFRGSISFDDAQTLESTFLDQVDRLAELSRNRRIRKLAMERLFENLHGLLRPLPGEHIRTANASAEIGPDTLVVRRPESPCHIYEKGDRVRIQFPGVGLASEEDLQPGCIEAPLLAGGALRQIAASTSPFTAKELPDRVELDARVNLIRTLAQNGLLRLYDEA